VPAAADRAARRPPVSPGVFDELKAPEAKVVKTALAQLAAV